MTQMELRMEGLDVILRGTSDPEVLRDPITIGFRQSGQAIAREESEEAPRGADSALARSMEAEVEHRSPYPTFVRVGPSVAYGQYVAEGTRPHFPPPRALERWVRLKLGVPQDEVRSVAFLIARKISQTGTEANPFHIRGLENAKPELIRIWGRVADGIARGVVRGR